MPVPSSYTEDTLKAFCHTLLTETATGLGWSVDGGSYDSVVEDVLIEYGVPNIAEASDLRKIRALARVCTWKKVLAATSLDYTFSADGGSFQRGQMFDHAKTQFELASVEAASYLGVGSVTMYQFRDDHTNDPYLDTPYET